MRIKLLACVIAMLLAWPASAQMPPLPRFEAGPRLVDGTDLNRLSQGIAQTVILAGVLKGANFNTSADQPIAISSPTATYRVNAVLVANPSTALSTAAGGIYTAAAKAGIAVVPASQAYAGLTSGSPNAAGSLLSASLGTATVQVAASTLFLSLTTPQGAAATADVYVYIQPLP